MSTYAEPLSAIPDWLDDPALSAADRLPEVPSWLVDSPLSSEFLAVPDCPCCFESEPIRASALVLASEPVLASEQLGWAVPGVWGERVVAPRPAPSPAVRALDEALALVERLDPTVLPVDQALVDIDLLLTLEQRLRRFKLRGLADARSRRLYTLDDEPTMGSWLSRRHPETATADVTLSDKLRRFPLLRSRVLASQLPIEAGRRVVAALGKARQHLDRPDGLIDGQPAGPLIEAVVGNTVDLVVRAILGVPDEDDPRLLSLIEQVEAIVASVDTELGKLEAAFVLLAEQLPAQLLRYALAQQLDALLPGELETRADKAEQARRLSMRSEPDQAGGDIVIKADDELYELLWTLLGAQAGHDPANPADTAAAAALREQDHDPDDRYAGIEAEIANAEHRPRSKGQRLHDALKNLLQHYLDAGLAGSHDKTPVAITVTIPSSLLDGRPGALPGTGGSGKTLPASLIRRWWCDAKVTAFVLTHGLIPLGIIHSGRTLTGVERKAALLQHDNRCAGIGCCTPDDPLVELVPHHVTPWASSGQTSLADTILACQVLHHDIHHGKTVKLRNHRWLNQHGWTDPPDNHW